MKIKILFFIVISLSCKNDHQNGFNKIPDFERKELINKIIPEKRYPFWEYKWSDFSRNLTERIVGDSTKYKNIINPKSGFFPECMPGSCFSYIVYDDFGKIKYITTANELKSFIGLIDNLEEALLIAKINKLWSNKNDKRGGSYKKTNYGFILYLTKSEMCPVTYYSIKVNIDSLGNFRTKNEGVYYKSSDCIMI